MLKRVWRPFLDNLWLLVRYEAVLSECLVVCMVRTLAPPAIAIRSLISAVTNFSISQFLAINLQLLANPEHRRHNFLRRNGQGRIRVYRRFVVLQ